MSIQSDYRGSDELRRLLIDAAMEILREPDTPLDLRKVAEAAGKSRTAPYLVFGKESQGGGILGLRMAVAAEGARLMNERMAAAVGAPDDPLLAFSRVATAFLRFVDENPRLFRLMYGPEISIVPRLGAEGFLQHREFQDLLAHRALAGDVITDIILAAQEAGLLPPDPADDVEARRIAALGDANTADDPGLWEATEAGGVDPRTEYPSLRYTLVAWASLIGVAMLRLDEVLRAIRLEIPVEQGARIVTEAVFGLDPNPVAGAARMFLAAKDTSVDSAMGAGGGRMNDVSAAASSHRDSEGRPQRARKSVDVKAGGIVRRFLNRRSTSDEDDFDQVTSSDLIGEGAEMYVASVMSESRSERPPQEPSEPPAGPPLAAQAAAPNLPASPQSGPPTLTQTLTSHHGFRRAAQSAALFRGTRILWIDDDPASISAEIGMFQVLGGRVDVAPTSDAALDLLSASLTDEAYRIIISDVRRGGRADEGVHSLEQLRALAPATPVVFYVANLDRERGVPAGAYGITDDTDELVHLVMDVFQGR